MYMENKIVAYCGLVCSSCPAYIATQADDLTALEQVAAQWREMYHAPDITVESVMCDGCLSGSRKCGHCAECNIRSCGVEHNVVNCAYCSDFKTCNKIQDFFTMAPEARTVLDSVRAA
jgi:hypothetical protein